jgi:hypothetical protein
MGSAVIDQMTEESSAATVGRHGQEMLVLELEALIEEIGRIPCRHTSLRGPDRESSPR